MIIHNTQQWFTDEKTDLYIKNLGKLVEWERTGKIAEEEKARETFSMIKNRKEEVSLLIDRSQNVALYREIVAKLQTKLYRGLSAARSFAEKLSAKEEIFVSLSVLEMQCGSRRSVFIKGRGCLWNITDRKKYNGRRFCCNSPIALRHKYIYSESINGISHGYY